MAIVTGSCGFWCDPKRRKPVASLDLLFLKLAIQNAGRFGGVI
jgi:hypothetical protein